MIAAKHQILILRCLCSCYLRPWLSILYPLLKSYEIKCEYMYDSIQLFHCVSDKIANHLKNFSNDECVFHMLVASFKYKMIKLYYKNREQIKNYSLIDEILERLKIVTKLSLLYTLYSNLVTINKDSNWNPRNNDLTHQNCGKENRIAREGLANSVKNGNCKYRSSDCNYEDVDRNINVVRSIMYEMNSNRENKRFDHSHHNFEMDGNISI